jgi:dihydrofolate synthase/folylpolyglutamate synthase
MTNRDYLFSLERIGIKLGLDQIRALLEWLDHPERELRTILVAGTNGKGSVAAMVERGLRAGGFRTGRYTSPHLIHLEERFAIDGASVAADVLDEAAGRVREAAGRLASPPSFFEATTAAAFLLFRDAAVDVAVLEVGLGGRLDATNVTRPAAVAITQVARDHEALLGASLEAIAREKAGIIGEGSLVVLGANPPEVRRTIRDAVIAARASLLVAGDDVTAEASMMEGRMRLSLTTPVRRYAAMTLALRGRHQVENAVLAARLLEALPIEGVELPEQAVRTALEEAEWPARLDLRAWRGHPILIDAAHNPAGAATLAAYVLEAYGRPLPMVIAVMKDKDLDAMLAALAPAASRFVFTAPASGRAASPADLAARAAVAAPGVDASAAARPADALARVVADGDGPVVVAGSLYLAGEVLAESA